jgi:hypothetical protein
MMLARMLTPAISTSDVLAGADWLALFGSLRNARPFGLVLRSVELLLELIACLFEFPHAFAQAASKGRELLGAEKHKNKDGNDDELRGAKRTDG